VRVKVVLLDDSSFTWIVTRWWAAEWPAVATPVATAAAARAAATQILGYIAAPFGR
jgi:hypothetical protein